MGHVTSKQPWGTIDIDTDTGVILVQEDWHYIWTTDPGVKPFTLAEKRTFHRRLNREIWGSWSWYFRVHVHGNVPFAHKFEGRTFVINFDIRWVLHGGDWHVTVVRVASGTKISKRTRSQVNFLIVIFFSSLSFLHRTLPQTKAALLERLLEQVGTNSGTPSMTTTNTFALVPS